MRRPARRFGILVLALALVPGQFATADAGVIPWLYDAVFGPVGHYGSGGYGYGGYAYRSPYSGPRVSYMMPAAPAYYGRSNCGPAGCATSSYSVGYRPVFNAPSYCSTGGCSTVLTGYRYASGSCGTCSTVASANSACAAKTAWKSKEPKEAKTEWETEVIRAEAAVPTPAAQDEAPRPKTFVDEPADPSKGQPTSVGKVVAGDGNEVGNGAAVEGDPDWTKTGKPAAEPSAAGTAGATTEGSAAAESVASEEAAAGEATEAAGFGKTQRGPEEDVNQNFTEPVPGVEAAVEGGVAPTKTPALPEGLEGLPETKPVPAKEAAQPLNLEEQSSLKFEAPVKRIAFRAGFRRAKVARTSVVVSDDYVVPTAVTWRLVSR
jgi:hypothetical protein